MILATVIGFPISTTHALTGAMVGCGLLSVGHAVNFAALQKRFLLPLLFSPVLAIMLAALLYVFCVPFAFVWECRRNGAPVLALKSGFL